MATVHAIKFATGAQIRAGRALLGWRRDDLAKAAGLHPNAISYWERHARLPRSEPVACRRIRLAFYANGVAGVNSPAPGICRFRDGPPPATDADALSARHNDQSFSNGEKPTPAERDAVVSDAQATHCINSGDAVSPTDAGAL